MNNTITEMKNILWEISNRITEAEESIIDLEDRKTEISIMELNKEKRMKINEVSTRDLYKNIICINTQIIGIPEEEVKEKGPEKIFEEILVKGTWNVPWRMEHSPG